MHHQEKGDIQLCLYVYTFLLLVSAYTHFFELLCDYEHLSGNIVGSLLTEIDMENPQFFLCLVDSGLCLY